MKQALVVLLVLLFAADVRTTVYILNHGGTEANPFVRWLMRIFGDRTAGVVASKALVLALVLYNLPGLPMWLLVGIAVLYAAVVSWNFRQVLVIRRARG